MNLPDWPWLPNPDYRRLLQVLRREGPLGRTPFLELVDEGWRYNTNF